MKILSLFDGISCGMVALQRAGIEVERYDAYEIEKSAIAISKKNYPNICHCGNVYDADFSKYNDFDLLIGGNTECDGVSYSQRVEAVGNGWTVDVIAHILRELKK